MPQPAADYVCREISDEDYLKSLYRDGVSENGNFWSREEYQDPRYGDLYSLGDRLRKPEDGDESIFR